MVQVTTSPIVWTSFQSGPGPVPADYKTINDNSNVGMGGGTATSGPDRIVLSWLFDGRRRFEVKTSSESLATLQPGTSQPAVAIDSPVLDAYWSSPIPNQLDGFVPSFECNGGVDPDPQPEPGFNHLVNRTQIIETVNGVESVLANYDYNVEPLGPTFAQQYIDHFGGTRDLRVAYFAEQTGASTGLASYAVVEELLDENNVPYEKVIEVKTVLAHAEGYVGIFAGGPRVLRVAILEETTQPVA